MSLEEVIATDFYTAFKRHDATGMNQFYHENLHFEDPAFGKLSYLQTSSMWLMLCESAKDLEIDFSIVNTGEGYVETNWIAKYTFNKTGRFVENNIIAKMKISDGKIIEHIDNFNLHRWAKQAMGFQGWLLGGTSFFKNKLHQQTSYQLAKYMKKSGLS
jgi:SnoaL-like protein